MPKIIENVREQLLAEAKKQIAERGYAKTTIRSVAGACKVGVGTVYNYFPSKDMLIASFMEEDWSRSLEKIKKEYTSPRERLSDIYEMLVDFARAHKVLFTDSDAEAVFHSVSSQRHKLLRDQIADFVRPACREAQEGDFLAEFIAEALLTWTMAGKPFDEIYKMIEKLLK